MYEAFYGLSRKPFQLNPDPQFYFSSKPHRRARSYLVYGVMRGEGFIVITGEVGAGKTTIVRDLLESLDTSGVVAAHLVSTQLGAEDALKMVCGAFGVPVRGGGKADMLMALEAYFITQTTQGKRCLLIVDEAQNLTPRAVEELRMLSNFQYGNHALLQSFLVGQPEFRQILQSPHLMQFRQRVIAACHIGPLDVEETRAYIQHRLVCAGSSGLPELSQDAFEAIFKASSGIPRRINSVCDRLLLFGFLNSQKAFSANDVDEVAKEIFEETIGSSGQSIATSPLLDNVESYTARNEYHYDRAPHELIATLSAEHVSDRLARLEKGLLQLEQINSATLALLQKHFESGNLAN